MAIHKGKEKKTVSNSCKNEFQMDQSFSVKGCKGSCMLGKPSITEDILAYFSPELDLESVDIMLEAMWSSLQLDFDLVIYSRKTSS